MRDKPNVSSEPATHKGGFPTTRWSRVLRLGNPDEAEARRALERLCGDYWKPLYEFARRKGQPPEDAQDLTQGFIAQLLEKDSFQKADQDRGRFRTFLLAGFYHFMMGQHRSRTTLKRGSQHVLVSWDEEAVEREHGLHPLDSMNPETGHERNWALAVLERVMEALRGEYEKAGRHTLFGAIQPHLSGGAGRPGYAKPGESIGMSESSSA